MSYPGYCCQRCGEPIGYLGRLIEACLFMWHACKPEREKRPWTVDRDGRIRTDARPVQLQAKKAKP